MIFNIKRGVSREIRSLAGKYSGDGVSASRMRKKIDPKARALIDSGYSLDSLTREALEAGTKVLCFKALQHQIIAANRSQRPG